MDEPSPYAGGRAGGKQGAARPAGAGRSGHAAGPVRGALRMPCRCIRIALFRELSHAVPCFPKGIPMTCRVWAWQTLCVGHGKRRARGKNVNREGMGGGTEASDGPHTLAVALPKIFS